MSADPIALFREWRAEVASSGLVNPDVMVLGTVAADGQPHARHVTLRAVEARGFAFFANRLSPKGRQLAENPRASLVFPWFPARRQVVVSGAVSLADDDEAEACWSTRPRVSQLGSCFTEQSAEIPDRDWIERRWAELEELHRDRPIPRPDHFGVYWLEPATIEFWTQGDRRLHDRVLYAREGGGWRPARLAP